MAKESTVNGKKIGDGAGLDDNRTKIAACEIIQKVKAELEEEWALDAKGILHKKVMESLNKKLNLNDKESYMVIRAYAGGNPKKAKQDKESKYDKEANQDKELKHEDGLTH